MLRGFGCGGWQCGHAGECGQCSLAWIALGSLQLIWFWGISHAQNLSRLVGVRTAGVSKRYEGHRHFRLAVDHGAAPVSVAPITTADYPTPARRPANSRLDTTKLATAFDLRLPDWHDGAAQCVARLMTIDTPAPTRTTP